MPWRAISMEITATPERPAANPAASSHRAGPSRPGVLLLACVLLPGCATPGPNHIYTTSTRHSGTVLDTGPTARVDVPSFIAADEQLTGLAYDPYTDHLFLRLAPGNKIRVVDRPARQIKREFVIAELPATGGGDLAVRPRDGHLFFLHPTAATVIETNRFGEFIRRFDLAGLHGWLSGVAYDPNQNQLLVLAVEQPSVLHTFDLAGQSLRTVSLRSPGVQGHLAYDADAREVYVSPSGGAPITVFNEEGALLRSLPPTDGPAADFIDVGPRSFVRVF